MKFLIILLAILPGLLICFFIYKMDKYEKEYRLPLLISFVLGMIATIPGLIFQTWLDSIGWEESAHLVWTFLFSFFMVGLSEELLKFAVLMLYPFRSKFFNEPLDGIVYAVVIGMGFGTLENILYANKFGMETTIVRALTAVPAHAVFGVLMGYYVGLAKFKPLRRTRYILFGLGLAVTIHGLYDFFILQQAYEWLMVGATLLLYVSIYFAIKLIRRHQKDSPFRWETVAAETKTDEVNQDIDEEV